MTLSQFNGTHLGTRTVQYGAADAALYALAVGAEPNDLPLVYERDLRVLPTYAAALGIWSTGEAARVGGYDQAKVLHLNQNVRMHRPLPPSSEFEASARIVGVFDKDSAALIHIVVESEFFDATYVMFVPDEGGWGGDRGSSPQIVRIQEPTWEGQVTIAANAAALYRLTGDPHPVHIDPDLAVELGYRGPILHGLCTFGTVAREVSTGLGIDPTTISDINADFLAPVYPGDTLVLRTERRPKEGVRFEALAGDRPVLAGTFLVAGQPTTNPGLALAAAAGMST